MPSLGSSQIVTYTLWVLVTFSVVTWCLIFLKSWERWRLRRVNRAFGRAFWAAPDLNAAAGLDGTTGPFARIAKTGFDVLRDGPAEAASGLYSSGDRQDVLERCFRQRIQQERQSIEHGLTVLASIGSTAPFIGLFGTVWGIMHALQDISKAGSASLDVVAAPIGEALLATAIGIGTAIPAVLAYNFFLAWAKRSEAELESFATDFLHLAAKAGFVLKREV